MTDRPDLCDWIVNNGHGEPTECGLPLPCEYHDDPAAQPREEPATEPIGFLRRRIENGMPLYQGDVDAALAVARQQGRAEAAAHATERPDPNEPLDTILQAIVQHATDAGMSFDDLRVLARLIEKVEAATERPRTEPLDVERLAYAMSGCDGVNWPKRWEPEDFAWVARQIAASYRRLSPPAATQEGEH